MLQASSCGRETRMLLNILQSRGKPLRVAPNVNGTKIGAQQHITGGRDLEIL